MVGSALLTYEIPWDFDAVRVQAAAASLTQGVSLSRRPLQLRAPKLNVSLQASRLSCNLFPSFFWDFCHRARAPRACLEVSQPGSGLRRLGP